MPDQLRNPKAGPDAMYSTELKPTRGQYQTIATIALQLLGVDLPQHRLDASIAITRLAAALADAEYAPRPVPVIQRIQ